MMEVTMETAGTLQDTQNSSQIITTTQFLEAGCPVCHQNT